MGGYREASFHPSTGGPEYGRPLRPFNKWQWTGIAFMALGVGVMLSVFAARLGWIRQTGDLLPLGSTLCIFGGLLVGSRREVLSPEESASHQRRALIGALAICAVVGVILYFSGAF